MVLTEEQRKERKKLAQLKWRQKNREYARIKAKAYHEANKEARNARKRELYQQKKDAQKN